MEILNFEKDIPALHSRRLKETSLFALTTLILILLTGCSTGFKWEDLGKSDVNQVSEIHMEQVRDVLATLTEKLYKRNPAELAKTPGATIDLKIYQLFSCPAALPGPATNHTSDTDAIMLGLDPKFRGDRVFAVMYGLHTMILKSYNNKCKLFMLDYLNEQNLYNSARNIEILVWRLKTRKYPNGRLLLLTNGLDARNPNLSFERQFGKLISLQDTMAKIVSRRNGRLIKEVIQTVGMSFLPIGI